MVENNRLEDLNSVLIKIEQIKNSQNTTIKDKIDEIIELLTQIDRITDEIKLDLFNKDVERQKVDPQFINSSGIIVTKIRAELNELN